MGLNCKFCNGKIKKRSYYELDLCGSFCVFAANNYSYIEDGKYIPTKTIGEIKNKFMNRLRYRVRKKIKQRSAKMKNESV